MKREFGRLLSLYRIVFLSFAGPNFSRSLTLGIRIPTDASALIYFYFFMSEREANFSLHRLETRAKELFYIRRESCKSSNSAAFRFFSKISCFFYLAAMNCKMRDRFAAAPYWP